MTEWNIPGTEEGMSIPNFVEIRIENTNACGYKCVMCPRDKQTRELGYMSLGDFETVLQRLPRSFKGMFHLHGFGEPLLDRKLAEKIELLKKTFPECYSAIFSTLGVKLKEELLERLVCSGLNYIMISWYGYTKEAYQKIHQFDGFELAQKNIAFLSEKIKELKAPLVLCLKIAQPIIQSSLPMAEDRGREEFVRWAKDLGCEVQPWGHVHNYGDGRKYNTADDERVCPVVEGNRRNILHITWDLNVIPCCFDYNATISFGNLRKNTLEEIFSSPVYFHFIVQQKIKTFAAFPVCQNCEKYDL